MHIGAQLYTVRDFCKTAEDFAETLKKVADIGYTTVQVSGTCEFDPAWLKSQLDSNGLQCVITHTPPQKLQDNLRQVCDDHKVFGCANIGLGYYSFRAGDTQELYNKFCSIYTPIARSVKAQGLYFMYHNHNAEFRKLGGKTLLRKMAEDFAPEEMGFILDTFWIQAGGANPAEYIREFKGRVPCIHLKDYAFTTEALKESICAVGEGNINFDAVAAAAEYAGTAYMLVEQDTCHGEDPFVCLRRSYEYLKAMGLE